MSEANNPATAGLAETGAAPNDDIDTTAFDRMEAPADDEPEPKEPTEGDEGQGEVDEPDKPKAEGEDDDHFEFEAEDGQKYKLPKALENNLLMRASYTQKTQALAEQVKAYTEKAQAWEAERTQQAESLQALREDHVRIGLIETRIEAAKATLAEVIPQIGGTLDDIDWPTFAQKAQDDEQVAALYRKLSAAHDAAHRTLAASERELAQAKSDLQTKEEARLSKQREEATATLRQAQQETARTLAEKVPGWNKDTAQAVVEFMAGDLGLPAEEIAATTDPTAWMLCHEVLTSRAKIATLEKALKQQQTATNHEKAQGSQPAETAKGSGGSRRDPSKAEGDGLGTKEWMRRRDAQVTAAGRR